MVELYIKLTSLRLGLDVFPDVTPMTYNVILGFIFLASTALAYRALRPSSS